MSTYNIPLDIDDLNLEDNIESLVEHIYKDWKAEVSHVQFFEKYANYFINMQNFKEFIFPALSFAAQEFYCVAFKEKAEDDKEKPVAEITYKAGDKLLHEGRTYILAATGNHKVSLINIENGKYWIEPVRVVEAKAITIDEFDLISDGDSFTKIED